MLKIKELVKYFIEHLFFDHFKGTKRKNK